MCCGQLQISTFFPFLNGSNFEWNVGVGTLAVKRCMNTVLCIIFR